MPPTNVLDHLTPDEVIRLLERRPDGLLACGVIRTVQDFPGQTITRIEIDEDRVHVSYARPCHPEEVGHISARLLRLDAEACPDGVGLEFVSGTGAERQSEVLYVSLCGCRGQRRHRPRLVTCSSPFIRPFTPHRVDRPPPGRAAFCVPMRRTDD